MHYPRESARPETAPPALDRHQAAFIRFAGLLFIAMVPVGIAAALTSGQPARLPAIIPIGVLGIAILVLSRAGRWVAASQVVIWGMWIGSANGMFLSSGVNNSVSVSALCLSIPFSGWLAGRRTAVAVAALTIAALFAAAAAASAGLPFPRPLPNPPVSVAVLLVFLVVLVGAMGHYVSKSFAERIGALGDSERALADKVEELSRREVDLESLRRRFEALFRSAPTACALARPGKGEILDCNEAFCQLLGRPREEIVGHDSVSLGYWRDLGERDRAYALLARDGRLRDFEAIFVRPGGEARHCLIAWELVEFGGERQMIAQIADITGLRQAEEALGDSRAIFAAAFEASPEAMVFTRTRDGTIIEANPAFERLTGIPRAEAVGRPARELGHWGDLAERERIFRALFAGETVIDVPIVGSRRDGTRIDCRLSGALVTLRGEPHVLTIAQDVSAQAKSTAALAASERELAEANRRLRVQLSLHELTERVARVGHWFTDLSNDRVEWSRALFDLSGVAPRGPMTSEESRHLLRIEEQEALREAHARLDGTPHVYHFHRADGSEGWARASLLRAPDTHPESGEFFGVVQDITEEHEAKLALERLNAQLEQRVAERTAALRATNTELDAFAYSVAHDLNAPLRSINGFAGILERDAAGRLTDGDRERLGRIRAASVRMSRLIADLLRLSRLTRAPMHLEDVDLTALAREVAAEIATSQPDRPVEWRIEEGLRARADPGLSRALLQNLLGNAWKYTRDTPRPVIEFGRATDGDSPGEFRVRDNGAGFDMAYAARLFTPFQRLHGPTEFEGSGIGLATVQRIVHRHGGDVRAQAQPGRGASIGFTLSPSPAS